MKNFFLVFGFTLMIVYGIHHASKTKNDQIVGRIRTTPDVISMPLVQNSDYANVVYNPIPPKEDRGPEYRRFLAASVKIATSGGSGSGTIVYYDPKSNWAYVASCGHLWSGTKTAAELQAKPVTCKIIIWYQNENKLSDTKSYTGQVLFYSNHSNNRSSGSTDSSLVRFQPDWTPNFFPIADLNYPILPGQRYHSCGCDGGREVARYDVEIVGYRGDDLITRTNSPRPGRSGGGLLTNDGYYIGTCWATGTNADAGYFTPLKNIHILFEKNGYGWLLNVNNFMARKIPIQNMNGVPMQFPPDYVPIPQNPIAIPRH